MPAIINSDDGVVSGTAGLKIVNGNDGVTEFQQNGITQVAISDSGVFQFNSGYGSVAEAYGCRAWVNFDGSNVVAIRASGNVSSITDNATGDYTVNFSTSMPDTNYLVNINATDDGTTPGGTDGFVYGSWKRGPLSTAQTVNSHRFQIGYAGGGTLQDNDRINVTVFR